MHCAGVRAQRKSRIWEEGGSVGREAGSIKRLPLAFSGDLHDACAGYARQRRMPRLGAAANRVDRWQAVVSSPSPRPSPGRGRSETDHGELPGGLHYRPPGLRPRPPPGPPPILAALARFAVSLSHCSHSVTRAIRVGSVVSLALFLRTSLLSAV